jgi:DNA polymerase-3 subunit alpha
VAKFCVAHKISTIAVTDRNNMFGVMQWSLSMQEAGVKPIIGAELAVSGGYVTALCKNEVGYRELSNLLSNSYIQKSGKLAVEDIECLSNCFLLCDYSLNAGEIELINSYDVECAIAISRQQEDARFEQELFELSHRLQIPIVAAPRFSYVYSHEMLSVDVLLCIKNSAYLAEEDREKVVVDGCLEKIEELEKAFDDIPWAVENSSIVAQKCNFMLKKQPPCMPKLDIDNPEKTLRQLVADGLNERFRQYFIEGADRERYVERSESELQMITNMGFCDYFLIVADIVNWAKKNSIPVGPGRGSGASCLAAWALKITNVDPIKFNLEFERFLNPDRVSLPDFDIDFCQERRDKVIEYIQTRFGKENVGHIITFGSLQYRAAIRDVGRVMQIPYSIVDNLCKKLPPPFQGKAPTLRELREDGRLTDIVTDENAELFAVAEMVEGLPRHSSVHPAGVVIGNQKLANIVPLFQDNTLSMPVIQFAMKQAEQIGLVKFDILGLTILSTMNKTIELIQSRQNELKCYADLDNIPFDDKETLQMLCDGHTVGVFQFDTPGLRNLMQEMQPNSLSDLIAAGALYRPGPMQDIKTFIKCKFNAAEAKYPYEAMRPILEETYSVVVYQEQVLQIAKEIAGYSMKEADLLRRAMGKKIKSEMEKHREKFVQGVLKHCAERGESKDEAEEKAISLFENLARFASYGFAKAHAAPYGVMSYQSAYLKRHYTAEFLCASLMYEQTQEKAEELIQEARKMGIKVFGPSVNMSEYNFSLLPDKTIVYGLSKIKGVGDAAKEIIDRRCRGVFKSISDFLQRVNINKRALEQCVYAGAFDDISSKSRCEQFEEIVNRSSVNTISLFEVENEAKHEWDMLKTLKCEYEVLGTVFDRNELLDLSGCKIHNKLRDMQCSGILHAIGIGAYVRIARSDKKIILYKFLDGDGIQELMINNDPEIVWDEVVMEVDVVTNDQRRIRYFVKNIYRASTYLSRYRKVFIFCSDDDVFLECRALQPGNTSIYGVESNGNKKFIGDFQLTFEYLSKTSDHIQALS